MSKIRGVISDNFRLGSWISPEGIKISNIGQRCDQERSLPRFTKKMKFLELSSWLVVMMMMMMMMRVHLVDFHHHHHNKSLAQCSLTSNACFTIFCQLFQSRAEWLSSCRFPSHHSTTFVRPLSMWMPSLFPAIHLPQQQCLQVPVIGHMTLDVRHILVCPKRRNFLSITLTHPQWTFL